MFKITLKDVMDSHMKHQKGGGGLWGEPLLMNIGDYPDLGVITALSFLGFGTFVSALWPGPRNGEKTRSIKFVNRVRKIYFQNNCFVNAKVDKIV